MKIAYGSTRTAKEKAMNWKAPAYDEIKMDAEIGSYQEDRGPAPEPIVEVPKFGLSASTPISHFRISAAAGLVRW